MAHALDRSDGHASARAWISRRELMIWIASAILANQALHVVDLTSLPAFAASVLSLNLVYWLAGFVILSRIFESDRTALASSRDVAAGLIAIAALGVTGLVGYRMGVGVVSTGVALLVLARRDFDAPLRAAGAVLLALSAYLVWGPIFFQLVTPELLAADFKILRGMLSLWEPSFVTNGLTIYSGDGHAITLIGACSSFANVSIALLSCVAITMAMRTYFVRADVLVIAGVCAFMVVMNAFRICISATSAARHLYWHDGNGALILAVVQTCLIFLLAYLGARWAQQRRPS